MIYLPPNLPNTLQATESWDHYSFLVVKALLIAINLYHAVGIFYLNYPVESPGKRLLGQAFYTLQTQPVLSKFSSTVILLMIGFNSYDNGWTPTAVSAAASLIISAIVYHALEAPMAILGAKGFLAREFDLDRAKMVQWKPLPKQVFAVAHKPLEWLCGKAEMYGLENITSATVPETGKPRPALYVMNHSRYALEMGYFIGELYQRTGVYPRGLADHFHFATPNGLVLKEMFGAVDGTRENLEALFEGGEDVIVYPGGGQEVMKPSFVENYTLMWKERLGFCRYAIKHGYDIVPVACVGPEDMVDVMYDLDLRSLRKDQYLPVPAPFNPLKIQKMYFAFGERICTDHLKPSDSSNTDIAREVRDKTRAAVQHGIDMLKLRQSQDPHRFLTSRIVQSLTAVFAARSSVPTATVDKLPNEDRDIPCAIKIESSDDLQSLDTSISLLDEAKESTPVSLFDDKKHN